MFSVKEIKDRDIRNLLFGNVNATIHQSEFDQYLFYFSTQSLDVATFWGRIFFLVFSGGHLHVR